MLAAVLATTALIGASVMLGAGTASAEGSSDIPGAQTLQQPPTSLLGVASPFAVLAGAAVTIPGANIVGDVGAGAATTITDSTIIGTQYDGSDTTATDAALGDLSTAYDYFKSLPAIELDSEDLGGTTLMPGVYHSTAALAATGTVTFDADNNPDAIFVIQSDAALNTTASTTMVLKNGAKSSNIFWVTTGAATLGASSTFDGTIISNAAVTIGASSTLNGRALSVTAAVTLGATCTITEGIDSPLDDTQVALDESYYGGTGSSSDEG